MGIQVGDTFVWYLDDPGWPSWDVFAGSGWVVSSISEEVMEVRRGEQVACLDLLMPCPFVLVDDVWRYLDHPNPS